jgi:hypothetical protein
MRHASGKTSAKGYANGRNSRQGSLAREFPPKCLHGPNDPANAFHRYPTMPYFSGTHIQFLRCHNPPFGYTA